MIDTMGTALGILAHLTWWLLVWPRRFTTERNLIIAQTGYAMLVVSVLWLFDFSSPSQTIAFAALAATLINLICWTRLPKVERFVTCYSFVVTLSVFMMGFTFSVDPVYFSQLYMLATVAVAWIFLRLKTVRTSRINWLYFTGCFLFWIGAIAATVGLAGVPLLLGFGGLRGFFTSFIMFAAGIYGSLTLSIGLSLEMFSSPSPNTRRLVVGSVICLAWVVLTATMGLVR